MNLWGFILRGIMEKKSYVYRHRRLDTNEIFYIGIGSSKNFKRAYNNKKRSKWWKKVINKTSYSVEILKENLTWEQACELEILLISEYGRKDLGKGSLVNMTDGGEGTMGRIPSEKTKALWSKQRKGLKRSKEFKEKISKYMKGRYSKEKHPMWGKEGALKGKVFTKNHRENISKIRLEKGLSKGENNPNAKKVINKDTLEIINCAKGLSTKLNMKYSTLMCMLKAHRRNKTNWVYLSEFEKLEK